MVWRNAVACVAGLLLLVPAVQFAGFTTCADASSAVRAGADLYVDDDAPGDPGPGDPLVSDPLEDGSPDHPFDAIQEAVDAAAPGSLVLVNDGTYSGEGNRDIVFGGKPLTLRSVNGPGACIIDCESAAGGFRFEEDDGPDAVVEGLTVTNGFADYGGAIHCGLYSAPTIVGNVLQGNVAERDGGAILVHYSTGLVIEQNLITGNEAGELGGGIFTMGSSVRIQDNIITDNWSLIRGGGIMGRYASTLTLVGNTISGNESTIGGGLYLDNSAGTLFNNLITGNTAGGSGGAVFVLQYGLDMTNCTVTGNSAFNGGAIAGQNTTIEVYNSILRDNTPNEIYTITGGPPSIVYSNVQGGYTGSGNIDTDPLFVADGEFGYCLSQVAAGQPVDSPCVDAGSGPASNTCITLSDGDHCLDTRSTRTDNYIDLGTVDMGYHRLATSPVQANLVCFPESGTLPFTGLMWMTMGSETEYMLRRLAGRIDVDLGGGGAIANWRAGWTNLSPGGLFFQTWNQRFPALPSLVGENVFQFTVEDVTPPPYNQPPYPPAGQTATASCAVTGVSPSSSGPAR